MDLEASYCRLCAESKLSNKQVDLQANNEKKTEIIEKLVRVNATADFDNELLPKTVCFECIQALDITYDFVLSVENAQFALNQIIGVPAVKKENLEDDVSQLHEDTSEPNSDVKITVKKESGDEGSGREYDCVSQDSDYDKNPPKKVKKSVEFKHKRYVPKKQLDVDSIPLSQLSQIKTTWKSYSWFCTMCEGVYNTADELQKHSMEQHNMCNPYRCTDCKIRKMKLDKFIVHVQKHHNYLRFSCYKCNKQFKTAAATRKHKSIHVNSKLICPGCNSPFKSNDDLKKHLEDFCQVKRARRFPKLLQMDGTTCNICHKTFKTKSSLNTHVIIHTERKNEFTCDVCGRGFFLKNNLEAHMIIHKDERPYKCEICNFAFKSPRLLKNHVGVHTSEKPYTCSECGRSFRLRKQLESHKIIHTDIHPYSCPHCQKRFRFKGILNSHVRLHTGVRPYSCQPCQRDFTNWSNYNKHMKRKHNTDTSKKKRTPEGLYPIDPSTGEVIIRPETSKIKEWKERMLAYRGLGRPPKTAQEIAPLNESLGSLNNSV